MGNVDFDKSVIHVRERADRYNEIGSPKSRAGERAVPMTPIVANTLRELKLKPRGDRSRLRQWAGNVESHANIVNRGLIPAQIAAGIIVEGRGRGSAKYTGIHALRHFYASWCINP